MNINILIIPTLFIAVLLFCLGIICAAHLTSKPGKIICLTIGFIGSIPALLYVVYYLRILDSAQWYYELRTASYSELLAGCSGFFAGVLWKLFQQSNIKRKNALKNTALVIFILVLVIPYLKPIILPLDYSQLKDEWIDDICIQTSPATCGPCSAATLLKAMGIPASEKELAKESYTCLRGTEIWYLVRAIKEKGASIRYSIEKPQPNNLKYPSIAGVCLGSPEGAGHFIAIIGKTGKGYIIGDSLSGRAELPEEKLNQIYFFTGFFMVIEKY